MKVINRKSIFNNTDDRKNKYSVLSLNEMRKIIGGDDKTGIILE